MNGSRLLTITLCAAVLTVLSGTLASTSRAQAAKAAEVWAPVLAPEVLKWVAGLLNKADDRQQKMQDLENAVGPAFEKYLLATRTMVGGAADAGAKARAEFSQQIAANYLLLKYIRDDKKIDNLEHLMNTVWVAGNLARLDPKLLDPATFTSNLDKLINQTKSLIKTRDKNEALWRADGSQGICALAIDTAIQQAVEKLEDFKYVKLRCNTEFQPK